MGWTKHEYWKPCSNKSGLEMNELFDIDFIYSFIQFLTFAFVWNVPWWINEFLHPDFNFFLLPSLIEGITFSVLISNSLMILLQHIWCRVKLQTQRVILKIVFDLLDKLKPKSKTKNQIFCCWHFDFVIHAL